VKIGKLTNPDRVGLNNIELNTPLPGRDTLIIDTTELEPKIAAEQIVERYQLTQTSDGM
jgi:hypothetical protein